jgi:D-alanyl-D-alanine carboxypeptidase (penicillin-binding protein 5/6)
LKVSVVYDSPIPAPIRKGDQIGKVVVSGPDIKPIERPLFAATDVAPIGTIGRMASLVAYLIWGGRH